MSRRRLHEPDEVEFRPAVDLGPLFEPPSVPIDTSETAAREIRDRCARIQARVLERIVASGAFGATEREIEESLALSGNTVRPRLWELEGNAPAGKRPPPRRIAKTLVKRRGMRVYVALSCAPVLQPTENCAK
jgi:hypothetical protein